MIRSADILFYGGGECLQKFGVPVWSLAGRQRVAPTFTRSGAVGSFVDRSGILRTASADRIRIDWEDEGGVRDVPSLLLEAPAFVNLVTSDDIDGAFWTSSDTPVITTGIDDPAGGQGAFRVADDNAGAVEYKLRAVTFTGDNTPRPVVFVVREATMPAGGQALTLYDSSATVNRLRLVISAWSNGEPAVSPTAGSFLGKRYLGNGYWAIYGLSDAVSTANNHEVQVVPAVTSAQTGSIDVYRVNAYNATSPLWSILNASETKAAEALSFPFVRRPQAMCGHVRFRELEVANFATQRIMQIGAANDDYPRLIVYRSNAADTYAVQYRNAAGDTVETTVDVSPAWGDMVDVFWWLIDEGDNEYSVNIAARKKSPGGAWGAITTGMPSAALAFADGEDPPKWSGPLVHFGSVGASGQGMMSLRRSLIARDNHSTDDLLATFEVAA